MPTINSQQWEAIVNNSYAIEFDWIGTNHIGHTAVFSSYNTGYIPEKVKYSFELYLQLDSFIQSINRNTTAILVTKEKGNFKDWLSYTAKGLFAFDYQDIHRKQKLDRYDLIAQPTTPLSNLKGIEKFINIIPTFNLVFDENISIEQLKKSEY